jgi:uncharacterized beta-barrel protein YwiB (DUF1934 family)
LFDKLNATDKKNIAELKVKAGELMLLIDRVSLLIAKLDNSTDVNVNYIMCNEVGLECVEDVMIKLKH